VSTSWERIASHAGGSVAGLAAATSRGGETLLFAATPVGVFHSTDDGHSWRLPGVNPSVPFADVVAPSPHFADDQTLFVCGADGLYRSTDAGDTWQRVLIGSRMLCVVVSPADTPHRLVVLVGTEADGILVSHDIGRTWTGANAGLLDLTVISLAVSPCFETDHTAFAGTASGVYRTRNAGRSWRSVDVGLDEPAVQSLAVSPNFADDKLVVAGTESDGLLISTDAGATWHTPPPSLAHGGVAALTFAPGGGRSIAAATDSGIGISQNGGETWHIVGAELEPVLSLLFSDQVLFAGLHRQGIVRSDDGGATWRPVNQRLTARLDTELVLSPHFDRDRTLLVGCLQDGLRVSTDAGVTWEDRTTGVQELTAYNFALSEKTVYLATSAGIRISRDGALTWQVSSLVDDPARVVTTGRGVALTALEGGKLFISEDDGRSWRGLESPFYGTDVITLAVSHDRTLFVATSTSTEVVLWRSIDGGERWQRWLVEPAGGVSRMPLADVVDGRVFVGLGGRVFKPLRNAEEVRSGERRPVWRGVDVGDGVVGITALCASPAFGEDHTLFAATNAGIFVSRDSGDSFHNWNEGLDLDQTRMVCVAVSPTYAQDRLVYGLGLGGTVWRRERTEDY
jgi:photosystem II stability/assembly factor-like uncharacterized protein